jgi:hypothetical protein
MASIAPGNALLKVRKKANSYPVAFVGSLFGKVPGQSTTQKARNYFALSVAKPSGGISISQALCTVIGNMARMLIGGSCSSLMPASCACIAGGLIKGF